MAPGDPLPDSDHVARYCRPLLVDHSGWPKVEAFQRRQTEDYASVNWIEFFDEPDRQASVAALRRVLTSKGFGLGASGKLAVLSVAAITQARDGEFAVRYKPEPDDASHSGICGYPEDREDDLDVALELSMLIVEVFPARHS